MEARLAAQGTTFMAGNDITIGDFQIYCEFLDLEYFGWDWSGWPTLAKWADACRNSPGLKEVHDQWYAEFLTEDFVKAVAYPREA